MNATLLAFNTVERLLKGDFFHAITLDDLQRELATLPPDWPVLGLGTTNWQERHGELLVEGTAGAPRFLWADPESDPPASIVELDATQVDVWPLAELVLRIRQLDVAWRNAPDT